MRQAVLERHNKNTQSPSSRTRTQRGWAELSDAEMSQTLGPLLDIQKPRSPHHVIVDTLSCSAIFHKVCGDHHTVTGIPNRGEQKNIPSVSCKSPLCSDDKHPTLDTLDAIAIHGGFGDGQLGVRGHGIGPVVAIVKFFSVSTPTKPFSSQWYKFAVIIFRVPSYLVTRSTWKEQISIFTWCVAFIETSILGCEGVDNVQCEMAR